MDERTNTREVLARQLKEARRGSGLSVPQVAESLGVKPNTVYAWEGGQNQPDAEKFLQLCSLYHADISDFYGTEPTKCSTESQLSAEEADLLECWRRSTQTGRDAAMMVLKCNEAPVKKESAM